jgi:signal peptidase II
MKLEMSIPVIKHVFYITYILNPGAAFGVLEHKTSFFLAVAVVMIAAVVYYYPRIPRHYKLLRVGIALMAGGAIGNVIDRIRTGYVVDFFDFRIWPVFNIADTAIVIGVCLIIYSILFISNKEENSNDRAD